jgi:hypothetical protein
VLGATLSTINLTRTGPGSQPGLRSESPATKRLSQGATEEKSKLKHFSFVSVFPRFPKEHFFLEVPQSTKLCPSVKSNMRTMIMEVVFVLERYITSIVNLTA